MAGRERTKQEKGEAMGSFGGGNVPIMGEEKMRSPHKFFCVPCLYYLKFTSHLIKIKLENINAGTSNAHND